MRRITVAALAALVVAALGSAPSARALTPNDPAWSLEWGPRVTRTVDLWDLTTGDPSVVIAVVDTGVASIPDLAGALVPGWNFVDGNANTNDTEGHGTWVASVAAARGNNALDAAGYCWRCSVMPVRVSDGVSPAGAGTIAQGIVWAVDHGARIINVSLDGNGSDFSEQSAIAYAVSKNVLVLAAAGNSGDSTPHYPAAYPSVLSVAGTDQANALYSWSTRGDWVNLAAPGCATVVDPSVGVAYGCGSSFAPAAVAGIAGLLFSLAPTLTAAQVADALRSTAHPVGGIGGGTVDAMAALDRLGIAPPPAPPPPPPPAAPPAAPAPPSGIQISTIAGVMRGSRVMNITTGSGALEVRFSAADVSSCQLELQLGRQMIVSTGGSRVVTLRTRAARGPHRLTARCTSNSAKRFTVTIASTFGR